MKRPRPIDRDPHWRRCFYWNTTARKFERLPSCTLAPEQRYDYVPPKAPSSIRAKREGLAAAAKQCAEQGCKTDKAMRRASERLYGSPDHYVGKRGMARQRAIELAASVPLPVPVPVKVPDFFPDYRGNPFVGDIKVGSPKPPKPLADGDLVRRFGLMRRTRKMLDDQRALGMDFEEFARDLNRVLPVGREASLAFTALEAAKMWAHRAITTEGK